MQLVAYQPHTALRILLTESSLAGSPAGRNCAMNAELCGHSIDAVHSVEILDNNDLETRGATLSRGNDRPGEKELPDLGQLLALSILKWLDR